MVQTRDGGDVWTTVSFDKKGNVLEVRDREGKAREGRMFARTAVPEEGGKCPEGETEITVVQTIEIVYVTCADTSDPCWVYNPATKRWYREC
jgi:hypothetical protein